MEIARLRGVNNSTFGARNALIYARYATTYAYSSCDHNCRFKPNCHQLGFHGVVGYHMALTQPRSPVQSWMKAFFRFGLTRPVPVVVRPKHSDDC